jgi:hypothetical protein
MGNYFSYFSINKYINLDMDVDKNNKFNRYKNEPLNFDYLHTKIYIPKLKTIKE